MSEQTPDLIPGHATADGTRAFADRARAAGPEGERVADGHFRDFTALAMSSIGIGTYLGDPTDADDAAYEDAVGAALARGINAIDTAVNYRFQRSERAVGRALRRALASGVTREQVVIATKGGFLSFDGDRPPDPRAFIAERLFEPGVITPDDVVRGCHCMTPRYLEHQLAQSRRNLGVETIDLYYLHNPEIQLTAIARDEFRARIRAAFAALEAAVAAGHIRRYGTATWSGYRVAPDHREHLDMAELTAIASEVGGAAHHFAAVQLPYNMALHEAATGATQRIGDAAVTPLEAAAELGLYTFSSASIYQGKLADDLSPGLATPLPGLDTHAQRALQFARSTPGLGTALVGMKSAAHVIENCAVARVPPADSTAIAALLYALESAEPG